MYSVTNGYSFLRSVIITFDRGKNELMLNFDQALVDQALDDKSTNKIEEITGNYMQYSSMYTCLR